MYGTVARMRVKAGQRHALLNIMEEWNRERRPKVEGAQTGYVLFPDRDPNQAILMAVFDDKDTYMANAADPEQDKWFRRFRDLLEADPEWEDGEIQEG